MGGGWGLRGGRAGRLRARVVGAGRIPGSNQWFSTLFAKGIGSVPGGLGRYPGWHIVRY